MDGTKGSPLVKATTCAKQGSLDFDKISSCFKGDQGAGLVKAASEYFDKKFPKPQGIPHVEINGKAVSGPPYTFDALIKELCATGIKAGACSKAVIV